MKEQGLYRQSFEHDACGIGAVVRFDGARTRDTVEYALQIVEKLEHRAGKDASGTVGDGVGILLQICHPFFAAIARARGYDLGAEGEYGVGMFFFPQDARARARAQKTFETAVSQEGMRFLFWREVPVCPDILGKKARDCMPAIYQCFVGIPAGMAAGKDFERRLYVARRVFEQSCRDTYVASFSSRTVVYKGMFLVGQLRRFYPDLQDKNYRSALALVHSRFSTNTDPSWERAHPNRLLLHNGEINTIRGNIDRMLAREETMRSPLLAADMKKIFPVVKENGSDSASLDNTVEFLTMGGMDLVKAMMITIPEPWEHESDLPLPVRDFYRYFATMMEPWDGPAAILFTDGEIVGATLDRNGLRPARYLVTDDNMLVLASEVGVPDIPSDRIVRKSRLEPGKMLVADLKEGRLVPDAELKARYGAEHPYGEWLDKNILTLSSLKPSNRKPAEYSKEELQKLCLSFGYTQEDVRSALLPMARTGREETASMGVDVPLAALSSLHRPLFDYFKQNFAQVTNPPLDAIREKIVTSTTVYAGADGNLLSASEENCRVLQINNPVLSGTDMQKIKELDRPGLKAETVSLLYYKDTPVRDALEQLFVGVDKAYRNGANIVVLSDRGVDENHVAIPSLLAVSAVEQHLIRTRKRTALSVILESGEPRDVHHFAALFGYGAIAVHPYLAHAVIEGMVHDNVLDKDPYVAVADFDAAVLDGVVKIASKMGIATLQSYQSAQIFEAVGIAEDVVERYFSNTVSRIGGIGLEDIDRDIRYRHERAFDPLGRRVDLTLDSPGLYRLRSGEGAEEHLYSPAVIVTLQQAARTGDFETFLRYSSMLDREKDALTLRGLFEFAFDGAHAVPLSEVESEDSIVRRFKTGAMSYGSISQEAHECLAAAMNALGGKSNSGEGGELPERLHSSRCSAIKQVASGRFGVTSEYLLSAREIQIKMAQGAKPGEGGHLPGKKVYPWIARTRHSTPGVSLISPPPHHDIYSIEDLAQLIYDLKNANHRADISVKLVSEAGVGTVAAGVAKAGAGVILISGYDGGTGAAPRNSIHNAGMPWEIGIAEAHRTLVRSGLRERVRLEADGKLMNGRDVAVACMLGAEEFGFATAPLVVLGCMMMRVCNLDTCPFGVATQNPELRKRFCGKPEYVVNFMRFVARELRMIMAQAGVRTVDELVGRTDLLRRRQGVAEHLDLSALLAAPLPVHFDARAAFDFGLENTPDERVLIPALLGREGGCGGETELTVGSTDRAFGTRFGSEVTARFGTRLPEDTFRIRCNGSGGQSFGAFLPGGVTIRLEGDGNDYFGKGLSGGKLVLVPPQNRKFRAEENVIVGNVVLYGATSGKAYIRGVAGERFCVRNSGATAVVEGAGDHACEYMTGGVAVILGPTGKNFAAGMSGGVAYVYDPHHDLYRRLNHEMVSLEQIADPCDAQRLRGILEEYFAETGSEVAERILASFAQSLQDFKKVIPVEYKRMLELVSEFEAKGMDAEEANIAAFYRLTGQRGQ